MRHEILDHGYIELVETWGSDERIIEAARMSTGKGFKGWGPKCPQCSEGLSGNTWVGDCPRHGNQQGVPGDERLLQYLYENKHSTPFEMAGLVIEVQAPIFVFRQWHRHRTQSYNEMSARYTPLPDVNFTPSVDRCIPIASKNKQARGATKRTPTRAEVLEWLDDLGESYERAQYVYAKGLALGIPKEVARCPVPVARYTRMRASANLRNWLAFLTLRMDPHAQEEIRVYADAVGAFIKKAFPRTWGLFVESTT